ERIEPRGCKGLVDVANCAGIQDIDLLAEIAGGGSNVAHLGFRTGIVRIHENGHRRRRWPQLAEQPQTLRLHLVDQRAYARDVAARTMEVGHAPGPDRIGAARKNDWYGRGRRLGGEGRWVATDCHNDAHLLMHEVGDELCQPIVLTLCPPVLKGNILTLDKALFIDALTHNRNERRIEVGRTAAEQADSRKRTLLRARRERPRRRAAESEDELAPVHSITSSARAMSVAGTSRPS